MKKLVSIVAMLTFAATISFSQTTEPATTTPAPATTTQTAPAKKAKTEHSEAKPATEESKKVKKEGAADKHPAHGTEATAPKKEEHKDATVKPKE